MYDVIVIGYGPAGISSAIYAKRSNLNVLVLGMDNGALAKAHIDNYYGFAETISGAELIAQGIKQAERLQIEVKTEEMVDLVYQGSFQVVTTNNKYEAKSVILATGAKRSTFKIPGLKELEGKGVSYCVVCDGFFYRQKKVALLGNTEYTKHELAELKNITDQITVLSNGEDSIMEDVAVNEKKIKEIVGKDKIEKIIFADDSELAVDALFVAAGAAGSYNLAKKLGIAFETNHFIVDQAMQTNIPGLFACGDVIGGTMQIVKAANDGMIAGKAASKYVYQLKD